MKNSYLPWSDDDIDTLHTLVRSGVSVNAASRILKRTPKAIAHAMKNSLYQQLLSHHPDDVASYFNTSNQVLESVVPKKYYRDAEVDAEVQSETDSDDEVIVSSLGCYKSGRSTLALPIVTMGVFGCIAYYTWILRNSWMTLA